MAALAPVASVKVTKPKPRDRPVSRSLRMATSVTLPCWEKRSRRSFSVVSKERFPTYNFICDLLEQYLRATEPFPGIGFQITNEETHLTIYRTTNRTELIQEPPPSSAFGNKQAGSHASSLTRPTGILP